MKKYIVKHKHHIIPKHMGGSNDKSNIVELTVQEHAEAHRLLYEKFGKLEDKIAWLMLSGKTDEGELERIELARIGHRKYLKSSRWEEQKKHLSKINTGKVCSRETSLKLSKLMKEAWNSGKFSNRKDIPREVLKENYKKVRHSLAAGRRNSKRWRDSVTNDEYKRLKMLIDPRSTKILVEGVLYNSIREASRLSGISYYKLRNMLKDKACPTVVYFSD